jgi:hypothetical protein
MKKIMVTLLILLLVVGGGVWYYTNFYMDNMIQRQIEASSSSSLGTRVSVGSVETNIKDGSLNISSVTVANPPGYKNKNAISLNGIEAAVDYANFDIKRMVIDSPDIVIEEKGGKTNFTDLMAALQKTESSSEPASDADADGQEEPAKEEKIIVLRHFRMSESRAAFESESLDHYSNIKIGAVELNDLKGTPTEVSNAIANEILSEVTKAAAIEILKAQARKHLDKAEVKVSSRFKELFGGDDKDADADAGQGEGEGEEGGNK